MGRYLLPCFRCIYFISIIHTLLSNRCVHFTGWVRGQSWEGFGDFALMINESNLPINNQLSCFSVTNIQRMQSYFVHGESINNVHDMLHLRVCVCFCNESCPAGGGSTRGVLHNILSSDLSSVTAARFDCTYICATSSSVSPTGVHQWVIQTLMGRVVWIKTALGQIFIQNLPVSLNLLEAGVSSWRGNSKFNKTNILIKVKFWCQVWVFLWQRQEST